MINAKMPAYPLVTIDPLFSLWSFSDKLYDDDIKMWTGENKPIHGNINIDGEQKRFMGTKGADTVIEQTAVAVSLTSTRYTFKDSKIKLTLTFTMPFLLGDLAKLSRPTSYIDINVESIDKLQHKVKIMIDFSERLTYATSVKKLVRGGILPFPDGRIGYMGRLYQRTLASAGDQKEIDWGWFYLAGESDIILTSESAKRAYFKHDNIKEEKNYHKILASVKSATISPDNSLSYFIVPAYDDLYSIIYFGEYKKAFWTTEYYSIVNAIKYAVANHADIIKQCVALDDSTEQHAIKKYGADYYTLLVASYRQTLASAKLINVGGEPIYLSKECGSNGSVGTVDVSYPSSPMFLFMAPELLRGMLLPVFDFSRMKCWKADFAPHDVGIYPYACGQVYGANPLFVIKRNHLIRRSNYICYQSGAQKLYSDKAQMPVEECGNMLIMSAAYFNATANYNFVRENADMLSQWADYLVATGIELDSQLCTDDFAGASAKNVNLAIKAVVAIAAWGLMLNKIQPNEGDKYLTISRDYAKELERLADSGACSTLTIDNRKSYSLKYNLVWDKLFKTHLFSDALYAKEIALYKSKLTEYGCPLDSRSTYTKTDWQIWAASLDDTGELTKLVSKAIVKMLANTKTRVPFTDWYDTITHEPSGTFCHRSVQGAMFMELYKDYLKEHPGILF